MDEKQKKEIRVDIVIIVSAFVTINIIFMMMLIPTYLAIGNMSDNEIVIQVLDKDTIRRPDGAFTQKLITYLIETDVGTFETSWDNYKLLVKGNTYVVRAGSNTITSVISGAIPR